MVVKYFRGDRVDEAEEVLSRETAVDHLVDSGFVRDVAAHLIKQLLLKDYLYEAEDGLHLTDGP